MFAYTESNSYSNLGDIIVKDFTDPATQRTYTNLLSSLAGEFTENFNLEYNKDTVKVYLYEIEETGTEDFDYDGFGRYSHIALNEIKFERD